MERILYQTYSNDTATINKKKMNYLFSKNKITNRESNFELLRIICMLLIIWGILPINIQ